VVLRLSLVWLRSPWAAAGLRAQQPATTDLPLPGDVTGETVDQSACATCHGKDGAGTVTTGLLQAARYVKDNRVLPRGFDKSTAHVDIAVHGDAQTDGNLIGEQDRVRYVLPSATRSVDVVLRYQPIAFRWAQNLRHYKAPEPSRFLGY
jgi:hypothetical protein